jgi:hypothetical protein
MEGDMQENNRRQRNDRLNEREAEATTDETLSELEDEQDIAEGSKTKDGIPAPDSEPEHAPRDDEGLM